MTSKSPLGKEADGNTCMSLGEKLKVHDGTKDTSEEQLSYINDSSGLSSSNLRYNRIFKKTSQVCRIIVKYLAFTELFNTYISFDYLYILPVSVLTI